MSERTHGLPEWLAEELGRRGGVPAARPAAEVVGDGGHERRVWVSVLAGFAVLVALVAVVVMHAKYEVAAGQRDEYRAELSASRSAQVGATSTRSASVRVAGSAQVCGTPFYVDANGVRSVFVYDGTAVVPMPGDLSWHLVDERYNVWGLVAEGDGADPARDANGRPGWWIQVRGVWCGVGDPGVAQVSQAR